MSFLNSAGLFGPDIPDLSMFQSPLYQFSAAGISAPDGSSPVEFNESLNNVGSTTASGDPTFNSDFNNTGTATVDYDGNDYHIWPSDNQLPTGSSATLSIFVTYYTNTASDEVGLAGYDGLYPALRANGTYGYFTNGTANATTGASYPTGTLDTMGVTYDVGAGSVVIYGGGSEISTESESVDMTDANRAFGYVDFFGSNFLDGGIHEVVFCDTIESTSDYQTYHNERT